MDSAGLITIRDIVDDYLIEIEDYTESDILRYMRLCERAITQLNIFSLNSVSTVVKPVNTNLNTVSLPDDFIRLIRLGIRLNNGRIYTLTSDEQLMLNSNTHNCSPSNSVPAFVSSSTELSNDIGENVKFQYRGGVSEVGTYRLDEGMNRIQLGVGVLVDEVILEYVSSGLKIDGKTYVPLKLSEVCIAYIKWKSLHKNNSTLNERAEAKQNYAEEVIKLREIELPSFDEIYDVLVNTMSPLIRR